MFTRWMIAAMIALPPTALYAQHGGASPSIATPPREATQFDFLIGQWDLVAKPAATTLAMRIHGAPRFVGSWKAWRAFDGFGIEFRAL